MSWFWKSSNMQFLGNPWKMVDFHRNRKSSEMVVWGWYMTHFDRRDILNSKKNMFGSIPNLARPPWGDMRNFSIFSEISSNFTCPEKRIFPTSESEIFFQKLIFPKFSNGFWNCDTLAPFWYIYIGQTPNSLCAGVFWNLVVPNFPYMCISLFWKPLNYLKKSIFKWCKS